MQARRVLDFMRPACLRASLRYERAIDCGPLQRIADLKTFRLVRDGSVWMAFANVTGSVVVGFLGVVMAVALTSLLLPRQ